MSVWHGIRVASAATEACSAMRNQAEPSGSECRVHGWLDGMKDVVGGPTDEHG